jgi:hypothetical protein
LHKAVISTACREKQGLASLISWLGMAGAAEGPFGAAKPGQNEEA